jgi:hypothetical protein
VKIMKPLELSYQDYLKSNMWRSRHAIWLRRTNYRCQLFPWLRVGKKIRGRYYPYAMHHMHINAYRRQGGESWNRDVIVLSPYAHDFVFHWLLSGGKRKIRHQKDFPNLAQRSAVGGSASLSLNWWCSACEDFTPHKTMETDLGFKCTKCPQATKSAAESYIDTAYRTLGKMLHKLQ